MPNRAQFAMRRILPFLLAFLASTAHAWGIEGHQVVAKLSCNAAAKQML